MTNVILWQRIEGFALFAAGIAIANSAAPEWSGAIWVLLFFAPDLSFFGYLAGPRIGALIYNVMHLYAPGVSLIAAALLLSLGAVPLALGGLWLAHCGLDRAVGYGLKKATFKDTHLGPIGQNQPD